jgi:hypothetical protein
MPVSGGGLRGGVLIWGLVALVGFGCPLLLGACRTDRAGAALSGLDAIQDGIGDWKADHSDNYPPARLVRAGGVIRIQDCRVGAYVDPWPTNPFSEGPMVQGSEPGDFAYYSIGVNWPGDSCNGYRLVLYGENGRPLVVKGADWDSAFRFEMGQLAAIIRDWQMKHEGRSPPDEFVSATGIGQAYEGRHAGWWSGAWPLDPYTGEEVSSGASPGDYEYSRVGIRHWVLTGFMPDDARIQYRSGS